MTSIRFTNSNIFDTIERLDTNVAEYKRGTYHTVLTDHFQNGKVFVHLFYNVYLQLTDRVSSVPP